MTELDLKKENDNLKNQVKGLDAQLTAAKQMVNEGLNASLTLRANAVLYQQMMQENAKEKEEMQKQLDASKAHVTALAEKVLELSPPKMTLEAQPVEAA